MRKRTLLIALAVIGLGLIGTGLSTIFRQIEFIGDMTEGIGTYKVSYGFPIGWHGYSIEQYGLRIHGPEIYWFSSQILLLDVAFWFAISSVGCIAIIKSMNMLHKARASENPSVINI